MFMESIRSDPTTARYQFDAIKLIGQYCRENPAEVCDAPYESRVLMAVEWFLKGGDGNWSGAYIRLIAAALSEQVEMLLLMGLLIDNPEPEKSLLWKLKHKRPKPAEKTKQSTKEQQLAHQKKVATKRKKKKKAARKSIQVRELRALIRYFRSTKDDFSHWIVGYIILATRLGWRPGEILGLERVGHILRASAQKRGNQRGLTATCEIDISAYCEKSAIFKTKNLVSEIDKWIADIPRWKTCYRGLSNLQDNINGRLATACQKCKFRRVCTYTFRHFAISCMKKSGFSRAEIAVLVNHATDRTAGEHYGRRRHGIKRPKKMLRFDRARLELVREKPRRWTKDADASMSTDCIPGGR